MRRSRSALRALADRAGVMAAYIDQTGRERRLTTDRTRVALLAAMRVDASSEAAAARELRALRERDRLEIVPAVRVTTDGREIPLNPTRGWPSRVDWELELTDERGRVTRDHGRTVRRGARRTIVLKRPPELGYHTLRLTVRSREHTMRGEQRLIVVPAQCASVESVLGGERAVGLTANVYTVRSEANWGVGDTGDLRRLCEWASTIGAGFVGLNPLHALRNRGMAISPYGPISRLFRNVLYVDVSAIPELADSPEARLMVERAAPRVSELRAASRLDYEAIMAVKRPVLGALHAVFVEHHRGRDTPRGRAYARYLAAQGAALDDFATWCAIDERQEGAPWRSWPRALQDAHGAAVRAFRERESELVDFHRWAQFELDRQLESVHARARELKLPIGLYQDLAVGAAGDGADAWMNADLFLEGVSIGAPPDPFATKGQNWGLPAMNPHRLAAGGYAYWAKLIRAALSHAGALRIDHILGLFRQFWIPAGMEGSSGAYVRFPAEDLLGVLALESVRANAAIVGEDLGTVPPEVPPALERWGVLSSKVLFFERDRRGRLKPPRRYPKLALATANTHDLPTIGAFWRELDIDMRLNVGAIPTKRAAMKARHERAAAREALAIALIEEGLWPLGEGLATDVALRAAVHAFLRRTPSWMVGIALDDLAGELEPVNLPGVSPDRWPSWTRRMAMPIEEMTQSADVRRALGEERQWIPAR
jgi:4-alpha-glucanotransferase